MEYNYHEAVSRNIGWISEWEQLSLRFKKVAIAGMGGVGGAHLVALARLGIGQFHIADLDKFEVANFNRQYGAMMDTLEQDKVNVLERQAKNINPEASITSFPQGINDNNIDEFLNGVDVFVDGFDFFVLDIRRKVFKRCQELGIPAITAAPIGMGTAYLSFDPNGMSFEDYFNFEGLEQSEQYINFVMGLAPRAFHRHYLIDPTRLDLVNKRGPSTVIGINLCAGVVATEVLKMLTGRGEVYFAPYYQAFDAQQCKWARGKLQYGNKGVLQNLKCKVGYRAFKQVATQSVAPDELFKPQTIMDEILNLARWAPSGDNTQPWKFEIIHETQFLIHAYDTRDWCVYDLDGHASQTAVGALLETIHIAAMSLGYQVDYSHHVNFTENKPVIIADLKPLKDTKPHPLFPYITMRNTQRRAYTTQSIAQHHKEILKKSVGSDFRVIWIDGFKAKWDMAKILFDSANIRLTIPEAYEVHKRIIQWDAQFSEDKIPDQAIGLDPLALKMMKWAMTSWARVKILNQFFAGTFMPRIQLDLLPGLRCGAHFIIVSEQNLKQADDYFAGGRAMQRFWLTATRLGMQFQPEMTPLIFSKYSLNSRAFTNDQQAIQSANKIKTRLSELVPGHLLQNAVFMGRIGFGKKTISRSIRQSLENLLIHR